MVLFQLWKHIKRGPLVFKDTQAVGYTLGIFAISGLISQYINYQRRVTRVEEFANSVDADGHRHYSKKIQNSFMINKWKQEINEGLAKEK